MDQFRQLGVPTLRLSPVLPTRSLFKQKTCFEITVVMGKVKDACKHKFGGSDQDWQFNPGKQKLRYIVKQEEVEDGSSWSARSSHFNTNIWERAFRSPQTKHSEEWFKINSNWSLE